MNALILLAVAVAGTLVALGLCRFADLATDTFDAIDKRGDDNV